MKMNNVVWSVSVVVFSLAFSSAKAQLQPPYFIDDFEDGSATDGDPVSWILTPPFDKGTYEVVDGDLVMTPSNEGTPTPGAPNWTEIDLSPDGLSFREVSLRTQLRGQRFTDYWVGFFARNTDESSIWAGIQPNGYMAIAATLGYEQETWTYDSNFDPSRNDIHLQLDVLSDRVMLWAWNDGDIQPRNPQLVAFLPDYIPDTGRVGVWTGEGKVGTIRTPVAVRYFEARPIPEPSSVALLVLGAVGLVGYARKRAQSW